MATTKTGNTFNATQLNYMLKRIAAKADAVERTLDKRKDAEIEENTLKREDKYNQIKMGMAKLKPFGECFASRYGEPDLFDCFNFVDTGKSRREAIEKKYAQIIDRLNGLRLRCEDEVYLGDQSQLTALLAKFDALL